MRWPSILTNSLFIPSSLSFICITVKSRSSGRRQAKRPKPIAKEMKTSSALFSTGEVGLEVPGGFRSGRGGGMVTTLSGSFTVSSADQIGLSGEAGRPVLYIGSDLG